MQNIKDSNIMSATRIVASTFGVLVGLAGIEHGLFEMLQGNVRPDSWLFAAIGPAQRFWEHGTEHAVTVVPNLFVTGILAMIVGLLVAAWSVWFVQRKYGAGVLLLLSILLFLVGGGFAPIFMAIAAAVTATRINKPLTWWRTHIPAVIQTFLAWLWPWSLIAFVLVFVLSVEMAIFGYPFVSFFGADKTLSIVWNMANVMLALILLAPFTAVAHDAKSPANQTRAVAAI